MAIPRGRRGFKMTTGFPPIGGPDPSNPLPLGASPEEAPGRGSPASPLWGGLKKGENGFGELAGGGSRQKSAEVK